MYALQKLIEMSSFIYNSKKSIIIIFLKHIFPEYCNFSWEL